MAKLSPRYPDYCWADNAGYATLEHRTAIFRCGFTPHHRRSFEPNLQFTLDLSG